MNQTQVNNFLKCLLQIDDLKHLALHARATAATVAAAAYTFNRSASAVSNSNNRAPINSSNFLPSATTHYSSSSLAATYRDHDHDHDHDDDHNDTNSSSYDLLIAKVTAMVVLFCASALCGSIPFMLNRYFKWTEKNTNARSATFVQCLLYFGGGVLICTTFLHLLPEVQQIAEQLQECIIIPTLTFPLAELLMCGGFFLMYFIEEVIHTYIHRHKRYLLEKDAGAGAAFERGHSVRNSYLVKGGQKNIENNSSESEQPTAPPLASGKECVLKSNTCSSGGTLSVQDLISQDIENQKYLPHEQSLNKSTNNLNGFDHHQHQQNITYNHHHQHQHDGHQYKHNHDQCHDHDHHSHFPANDEEDMLTSSIRGLFIVLALSLHELFEGMAIGLEGSASSVWFMFGAVSAHKLVLAFCVGVELIVARTRIALCIVYVMTFAIVSPIGIGIGILISYSDDTTAAPTIASAILQGMACGTLLYVVFFEILSKNRSGLLAYLALFVGFAMMFGLQQFVADEHSHSHGSCGSLSDDQDHADGVRSSNLLFKHLLDEQGLCT